jgi:hypothetical protein
VIEMDSMAIAMILSQQAQQAAWSDGPVGTDVAGNGAAGPMRPTRRGGRFVLAFGHWPYPAH